MQEYLKISLALSAFGFLKDFRPIESFLADYYHTSFGNITTEEINQEIYPIGTYSHVIQLLIVFLITDYFRYKPLLILLALSSVTIWGLMLIVKSKLGLQIIEVFYGSFCALEISYFSYIYAKTEKKDYQVVTSHTRSAILFGKFFASLLSQLLMYYKLINYRGLNWITFGVQVFGTIWCIFMIPSVKTSIYFNSEKKNEEVQNKHTIKDAFSLIWNHFKDSYNNQTVILWSIFYAISFGLFFQMFAYIQVLWLAIDEVVLWNPTVDAMFTLLGAFSVLMAGKVQLKYLRSQNVTMIALIVMCFLQGIAMYFAATSKTLLGCYILFIVYGIIQNFCITICATKIAENIGDDTHGLVFGFNTFLSLLFQTILTLLVVSNGFKLPPVGQYIVYSSVYVLLGILYFFVLIFNMCK